MSTRTADYAGRAILEVDPEQQDFTDDKGVTRRVGAWKLWVEDRLITTTYFWSDYHGIRGQTATK